MATQIPGPIPDLSELIKHARSGDEDAFGWLVNHFRQRIIGYCHRMLGSGAEDAAQEIFIKLYLALDRFDSTKPVSPFLFRIAHNHCLDILKRKGIRTRSLNTDIEDEQDAGLPDEGPNPEELMQKAELRDAVNRALSAMSALYRSPLIMWHVEGISYEEIAEILELPIGTIKARIHRGRNILQQKLTGFVNTNGGWM
ncbi:MAG: sigma-70 family RNA polymerase sigma factor [Deltaproteobacteria bacterium]|nr:sigma-70 family RNA polymerase sigma factor [Deltaproteobacteria bacterium]